MHHYPSRRHRMTSLSSVNLIFSLAIAMVSVVWALYLKSIVGSDAAVSATAAIINIGSVGVSLSLAPLFEKHKSKIMMIVALGTFAVAYLIFGLTNTLAWLAIGSAFLVFANVTRKHAFGELTKMQTKRSTLLRAEGLMYFIANIGWLLGPIVATLLLMQTRNVLLLAVCFMTMSAFVVLTSRLDDPKPKTKHHPIWHNIKDYMHNKNARLAYLFNFALGMWWPIVFIYLPLFIINTGLPEGFVGLALFLIIIPIIIMEAVIARRGVYEEERLFFRIGFLILAISGVAAFFVQSPIIVIAIIVASGVGIGFIEPTQESYFFRVTRDPDEKRFFSVFLTSHDTGPIIAKIVGTVLLLTLPFKFIFLIVGLLMLIPIMVSKNIAAPEKD